MFVRSKSANVILQYLKDTKLNMNTKNIKGLLFDFGGTIDTNGIHWCEMLRIVYQQCSLDLSDKAYDQAYLHAENQLNTNIRIDSSVTYRQMLAKKVKLQLSFLKENGFLNEDDNMDKLVDLVNTTSYNIIYEIIKEQSIILEKLSKKYRLGLVSNFYGNMETVLKEFGLFEYFSCVIDSALVGIRKPDPRIWQTGADSLGLNCNEIAIVGDSYTMDVIPAKSIGCNTIWLEGKSWCASPKDISAADRIIHKLSDLEALLIETRNNEHILL